MKAKGTNTIIAKVRKKYVLDLFLEIENVFKINSSQTYQIL